MFLFIVSLMMPIVLQFGTFNVSPSRLFVVLLFFPSVGLWLAGHAGKKRALDFLLIFAAVTFRLLMSLYALTPYGYRLFASENPLWEQVLVALNEFISVSLFSFVLGRLIARFLQPDVFTLQTNLYYNIGLLFVTGIYYLLLQAMWIVKVAV